MNVENTISQMRKGILEYCILAVISRGEIYASDILIELKEAHLIVVEGTLYPLLTRLKMLEFWLIHGKNHSKGHPENIFY